MLGRRYKALDRLDLKERRSLEITVRRQLQEAEGLRADAGQHRQDQIEVNKIDITVPGEKADASLSKEGKRGWKAKQEKLDGKGQKQNRPRGYRQSRDDPS